MDRVYLSLEAPYDGLLTIVSETKKFFKIRFHNGKGDTVPVDRLKPSYEINYNYYDEYDRNLLLYKTKALVSILKKHSCEPELDVLEVSQNEKRATFYNYIFPVLPLSHPEQNLLTNIPSLPNSISAETIGVYRSTKEISGDVKSKVGKIITE